MAENELGDKGVVQLVRGLGEGHRWVYIHPEFFSTLSHMNALLCKHKRMETDGGFGYDCSFVCACNKGFYAVSSNFGVANSGLRGFFLRQILAFGGCL